MTVEDCFEFGKIIKPHGLKGELLVLVTTEHAAQLKELKNVFLSVNGRLVPYFIDKLVISGGNKTFVQFEDMKTEADAEIVAGLIIYVTLEALPKLKKDQFYYHEVIGYMVVDAVHGSIGVVDQIYEMPGQDLIAVEHHGAEVLIPISEQIVLRADHNLKTLEVRLPDGLLDLYSPNNDEPNEN